MESVNFLEKFLRIYKLEPKSITGEHFPKIDKKKCLINILVFETFEQRNIIREKIIYIHLREQPYVYKSSNNKDQGQEE